MGGKSFSKPASRLNTSELNKLTSYCQVQLDRLFPRIERLRCIASKSSHGDLDLLCAFNRPDVKIGQAQVGHSSTDHEEAVKEEEVEAQKQNKYRSFCDDVAAALGADGWVIAYYGYPIIALQVPFKVVTLGVEEQSFWQVDVALVHPASFDKYLFTCSYNIPFALLVLATQSLSLSLWYKRDSLCLRHRPYFGQPVIEIMLIEDREELYAWLGLDMRIWDAGFTDYESIYRWITTNPAGSALENAWNRVAAGRMDGVKLEYTKFHTREDGIAEFIAWLKAERRSDIARQNPTPIPSTSPELDNARSTPRTSLDTAVPALEVPLNDIALKLLKASDNLASYEEQVKPFKLEAERIAAMNEKKRLNRIKAAKDEERGRVTRAAEELEAENITEVKDKRKFYRTRAAKREKKVEPATRDALELEAEKITSEKEKKKVNHVRVDVGEERGRANRTEQKESEGQEGNEGQNAIDTAQIVPLILCARCRSDIPSDLEAYDKQGIC